MNYIELRVQFAKDSYEKKHELLLGELVQHGFEGFAESGNCLIGYIRSIHFREKELQDIIEEWEANHGKVTRSLTVLEEKNWNEIWEKSFRPVVIRKQYQVLASFHTPDPFIPLQILVEPRMAFGTGHHATTRLMLEEILAHPLEGKRVLDVGCGTGILSILAAKRNAAQTTAVDPDPLAITSCKENLVINHAVGITVIQGTAEAIVDKKFDLVLANISTQVALEDMHIYSNLLEEKGVLLLSGFERKDLGKIKKKAKAIGLKLVKQRERKGWIMTRFIKFSVG